MLNRYFITFYLFALFFTIFLAYDSYPQNQIKSIGKNILVLDKNVFQKYRETFDINRSFGYIWGLEDRRQKNKKATKQKKHKKQFLLNITKNNYSLCVEKDCFRFLGIYHKKDKVYISLYNKNFKHKIDSFTINDRIGYTLYVKNIKQNRATIADLNSSMIWSFDLFDVNITKYKPKDKNEDKN